MSLLSVGFYISKVGLAPAVLGRVPRRDWRPGCTVTLGIFATTDEEMGLVRHAPVVWAFVVVTEEL